MLVLANAIKEASMKKVLFIIAGCLMIGVGAIGIILPILPTFPFLLAASICFLKSSQRLDTWFRNTKMYRRHVAPLIKHRGLTRKAKLCILIPVSVMLITLCIILDSLAVRIVIGVLLVVKIIVFIKMKTLRKEDIIDAQQTSTISMCQE